jgi:hypothetical protein
MGSLCFSLPSPIAAALVLLLLPPDCSTSNQTDYTMLVEYDLIVLTPSVAQLAWRAITSVAWCTAASGVASHIPTQTKQLSNSINCANQHQLCSG